MHWLYVKKLHLSQVQKFQLCPEVLLKDFRQMSDMIRPHFGYVHNHLKNEEK